MAVNDTHFCMVEYEGGLRPYRIFFPSSYVHAPSEKGGEVKKFPLVVASPYVGGDESAYFEGRFAENRIQAIAEERGYVVACPALPRVDMSRAGKVPFMQLVLEADVPEMIMAVVNEIRKQRQIDDARIYLMGASKGAFATYATAAKNPDTFAAVAGVCGLFEDDQVEALAKTPVLMYNATRDDLFTIERVRELREKLAAAGGEVKLVEVEGPHGGYMAPGPYRVIFDWFDAHRREAPAVTAGGK